MTLPGGFHPDAPMKKAHQFSSGHRKQVMASERCGCFFCESVFAPSAIEEWIDEDDGTALCPKCGIDSVIGDASGEPVTDKAFLAEMRAYWFS